MVESGKVYCWGTGNVGQLGDNNINNHENAFPNPVQGIEATNATNTAISLSLGHYHACAIMADGGLKCWGQGNNGKTGLGATNEIGVATSINGASLDTNDPNKLALTVSAGYHHTCFIRTDLELFCFGRGSEGQLGDEDIEAHDELSAIQSSVTISPARAEKISVNVDP